MVVSFGSILVSKVNFQCLAYIYIARVDANKLCVKYALIQSNGAIPGVTVIVPVSSPLNFIVLDAERDVDNDITPGGKYGFHSSVYAEEQLVV